MVTKRTFGYGSYRFELDSAVNGINPSVVLGLFTWSDDPAYTHREIDVECGRWANPGDVNNAQYVVQPWDWPSHLVRYAVPADLTNSTHSFTWETNCVSYQALAVGKRVVLFASQMSSAKSLPGKFLPVFWRPV